MVLLALENLGMEYMQQYCFSALKRMGDVSAIDPMIVRASRRDKSAIEVLGKIGSEKAVDSIVSYVDNDSDPQLQLVTLRALGEIGSPIATQHIANKLTSEEIEKLLANFIGDKLMEKEYEKSFLIIKSIKNYNDYFKLTMGQLNLAKEFNKALKGIGKSD